jgi:hypothetical protein
LAGKVHGGNAYNADGFQLDQSFSGAQCILFECADVSGNLEVVGRCDHHNPGDPGFGLGPEEFWEASSIGQLCKFLGVKKTHELALIAAGDHCPAHAYKGLCPGITVEKFQKFRMEGVLLNPRETFSTLQEVEAAMAKTLDAFEGAAFAHFGDEIKDVRRCGKLDLLPEVALRRGEKYLGTLPDTNRGGGLTGNTKIVLGGACTPQDVEAFFNEFVITLEGVVGEPYGSPERGYAGVVLKGKVSFK